MSEKIMFEDVAKYVLKICYVPQDLYDDYLQDLWFVYQKVMQKPEVTRAYVVQKMKWYILDQRKRAIYRDFAQHEEMKEQLLVSTLESEEQLFADLQILLTEREYLIVYWKYQGYRNWEIAEELQITRAMVSKYLRQIKEKLKHFFKTRGDFENKRNGKG